MDIIPVLDLMKGRVVHGVQGDREHYRPIQSVLTRSSAPLTVARALKRETDCRAFYVADLDAIQGDGHHEKAIRTLADRLGVELWVDAAIADTVSAVRLLDAGATRVIVGSETLPSLEALRTIRDALLPGQMLFSLDVGREGVLGPCPALRGLQPMAALDVLSQEGLSQVILLTLDQVGTGRGPDWSVLESARATFPQLSLIAGGGVRNPDDLWKLAKLGVDGALVATSLHRGWITGADLHDVRRSR
ncbi:MAG: HisA/HisF-related TIM barrel protein [Thermoleophilia bacterium]|nr:HisA/HisF-related TIM barrel protein [Thermoleophilia bacterium]